MSSGADMRNGFSIKETAGYFLISALLVMAHASWPELMKGALSDPDSYTRIVWLNDMLERSDALHKIVRDGSGAGTIINWTHLLTSVVYLLALPLAAFMPMKAAIHAAAVMFGPITVGVLGALAAWSLAPITETRWRWLAAVAVGVSAPVVNYGAPGVADHHTPLAAVALALAGCAGRVAAGSRRSAVALGLIAGIGIWLSPEALPFVAMSFGACVLPWIFAQGDARGEAGKTMMLAAAAFVALLATALLIDPPLGGYLATDDDRLSIVYLTLSLCLFLSFGALFLLSGALQGFSPRMLVAFCAIALPLAAWVYYFSSLSHGFMPFSSNEDVRAFFQGIEEMAPLTSLADVFCFLTDALVATLGLAWFAYRARSVYWLYAVGCLLVTILMGALHRRFLIYTGVASAAALPLLLDEATRLLTRRSREVQALARLSLVFLTLMPNRVYAALGAGGQAAEPPVAGDNLPGPTCNVREFAPFLAPFAGEVVMASVNDTPPLLYHTRILTVGSMGHRGLAAVNRLTKAWLSGPSETVPDAVRATQARFLLICRTKAAYARIPDDALFARLQRGETPAWAKEEINDPATGFVLYRIVEDKSGSSG
jgi:hypothetical protein